MSLPTANMVRLVRWMPDATVWVPRPFTASVPGADHDGGDADDDAIDEAGREERRDQFRAAFDEHRLGTGGAQRCQCSSERHPTVELVGDLDTYATIPQRGAALWVGPFGREHRGRRLRVEDLRLERDAQFAVEHDPHRRGARDHPHGQFRIVADDGADADHHGVARGAQGVRHDPFGLAADPLGVAGGRGDAAVERLGVLEHHERSIGMSPDVTEQGHDVHRRVGRRGRPRRGVGHRLPRRPNVVHPLRFGVEVPEVAVMGSGRQRHDRR